MPLVVVGTIAFDSIKTPGGRVDDALGGSATHFALASAMLAPTRLVGVVGDDFPEDHLQLFRSRGVNTDGVERVAGGKTFRWSGEYHNDMNHRDTLSVELNVIEDYRPHLNSDHKNSDYVFLANAHPDQQASVLDQAKKGAFVMADTMDLWIQTAHASLEKLCSRVDGIVLNDQEACLFTDEPNIVLAGRKIRAFGCSYVIIKKGEHGCIIFHEGGEWALPALPLENVVDPTGAGDSFAGGVMGYLARSKKRDAHSLKRAAAWGTVLASYCCDDYDVRTMSKLKFEHANQRMEDYCKMLQV